MTDNSNDEEAARRVTSIFQSLPPDEVTKRKQRLKKTSTKSITTRDGVVIGGDVGGDVNITVNKGNRISTPRPPTVPPPPGSISTEQGFILKEKVELISRLSDGRESRQKIWVMLKRRFKVNRYQDIPASQFENAVEYLRQWAGNAHRKTRR